ncbi:MAG: PcfJ domain-containing protein, partial [Spirochaetales bacterium]
NSYYYSEAIAEEEGYSQDRARRLIGGSDPITQAEKDIICDLYPDFVYMFQKWNFRSKREVMDKLIIWLEHKELELVLQAGFEYVGMNKNFWRLTEENRRATCLFMRQNPQFKNLTLQELRQAMKADSPKEYGEYLMAVPSYHRSTNNRAYYPAISYQDYKYLLKVQKKTKKPKGLTNSMWFNELMGEYQDYMHMLYRSEHDSKDEYWLYPSDLHAFHEKLVEEERLKREAEELARQLKREEEMRKKQALLKAIAKKYKGLDKIVDGYSIFITSDFEEWKRQAEKLHQCIVAAGYYQKMADQKSTIVFIQKDGEPMATAEISQAGKILQFYANELDRNDCKPSEEIQTAFNKWLDNIPKTKWKPRKIKEAA